MKISEKKLKQIISEEKQKIISEQKIPGAKHALREIAMLSAQLHDKNSALAELDAKDLLKLKNIAETLDIMFYRSMNHKG